MNRSIIIIGEGWAAQTAALLASESYSSIHWVSGSGAHLLPATSSMPMGSGAVYLEKMYNSLVQSGAIEGEAAELIRGSFLREFRNKAFREPVWTASPTPDFKQESLMEWLWEGEINLPAIFEVRFQDSQLEIFEAIRSYLLKKESIKRYEGFPAAAIEKSVDGQFSVTLANGEKISSDQVIYADRLSNLRQIQGVSGIKTGKTMKVLDFERKMKPLSAVQLLINHQMPIGAGVVEHFFMPLHRESEDTHVHQVWGYFTQDGSRSIWTVILDSQDAEDNHAVAKRIRRMKQTLNRTFTEGWLPTGTQELTQLTASEQVRMEENVIFACEEKLEVPCHVLIGSEPIPLLLEGFGPGVAIETATRLMMGSEAVQLAADPDESPAS